MAKQKLAVKSMVVVLVLGTFTGAGDIERVREFKDYQCRLTLPGPGFKWLDHTQIPQACAALGDDSGTKLIFVVNEAPAGFVLDASFVTGFDESFNRPGVLSKIDGQITTFQGVPCYEVHARLEQNDLFATAKSFAANGHLYVLQLISAELPEKGRNHLEDIFSGFKFTGTVHVPQRRPAHEDQAYRIGHAIGRITGCAVIVIVILWVVVKLARVKKRSLPPVRRDSPPTDSDAR